MKHGGQRKNNFLKGFPWLTIMLCLVLLLAFIALSSQGVFASEKAVEDFQLSSAMPQNILFYIFVHSGYHHLLGNLSVVLAAGIMVEAILGKRDLLAIFFGGAVFAGMLFALLNPDFSIIGASAGGIALLSAAFLLSPRRALLYFLVALVAAYAAIFLLGQYEVGAKQQVAAEVKHFEDVRREATDQNNTALATQAEGKIADSNMALQQIGAGEKLEATPPNPEIHFLASLFSVLYLFTFRKSMVNEAIRNEWASLFRLVGSK